jgi:chemotaxis protein MotB
MSEKTAPIIIIKKKSGHGGHHGGAWKVAYADFVTAMMALFIVLWLMNSSKPVRDAVAGYFADPTGGKGIMPGGTGITNPGKAPEVSKEDFEQVKLALEKNFSKLPEFVRIRDHVKMSVTTEGLRVELLEGEKGTFFESGSAAPSVEGEEVLQVMGQQLGKLSNLVMVEGHTDSRPFTSRSGYSNWELSTDRANAARRIMQQTGLAGGQVAQVRGFADQQLRDPKEPENASNRRVTIIVKYLNKDHDKAPDSSGKDSGSQPEPGKAAAKPSGP